MEPDKSATSQQAAESRNFFDFFAEAVSLALVVIDENGRILEANPAAAGFLKSGELSGRGSEILPEPLRKLVDEALRSGPANLVRELECGSSKGDSSRLLVETVRIHAPSGGMLLILQWRDAASLSRLERALRRLDRLASMGTFSAGMAHEVKNALVAIKTFVDRGRQREDPELVDLATREIRRIDSIVTQMLKFAAPAQPVFSVLRLHPLVEQALRTVRSQIEQGRIQVEKQFGAHPDLVSGDELQLEQALVNLFLNALAAMQPSGRLTIQTGPVEPGAPSEALMLQEGGRGPAIQIRIQDTGEGITPQNLSRLFEPFFTTKPDGTGLGLSIAQRIIREHHGEIGVESRPGQGTTFTIVLPRWTQD